MGKKYDPIDLSWKLEIKHKRVIDIILYSVAVGTIIFIVGIVIEVLFK